jgi:hypothetical protein
MKAAPITQAKPKRALNKQDYQPAYESSGEKDRSSPSAKDKL